jgi:hypothetical protein
MDEDYPLKVELLKSCHPKVFQRYRIVFGKASLTTPKRGKMDYGEWADSLGLIWIEGTMIPPEWFEERTQ